MMLNDEDQAVVMRFLLDSFASSSSWANSGDAYGGGIGYRNSNVGDGSTGLMKMMYGVPLTAVDSYGQENFRPSESFTTLMIRNIPRKCTQRMLLNDVITAGYGNYVDFVYLPTDISSARNLGYAFINFISSHYAECFRESFHKKHLSSIRGPRAGLSVSYALIQGLQANVDNVLKNSSIHRIRNPE